MHTSEIYLGVKKSFAVEDTGIELDTSGKHFIKRKIRGLKLEEADKTFLILRKHHNGTTYLDLDSSQLFTEKELDLESLVPFNRIFDCKGDIFKSKAIKLYNKKMLEKIPIRNLVLGNIAYVSKFIREDATNEVKINLVCSPLKRKALLLKEFHNYTDLETHIKYPYDNYKLGSIIVTNVEPIYDYIADENVREDSIEYYKVLSKYRKRFNK